MGRFKIDEGSKRPFYGAILVIFIYIFAVSLPSFGFVEQETFTGTLRFLIFPFIVFSLFEDGFKLSRSTLKSFLLTIPLALIAFGNLASLPFSSQINEPSFLDIDRKVLFTLMTALIEETIFRFAFMEAIAKTNLRRFDILISALVFGLMHLFALFGGSDPLLTLAQVGYTFLLGLLLGVAYRLGGLLPAFFLHFLFNFLQNDLFKALGGGEWNTPFFAFIFPFLSQHSPMPFSSSFASSKIVILRAKI